MRGRGRRLEFNLDYDLQVVGPRRDESPKVFHQLQANGTTELLEDLFFLDARSTYAQTNIDNTGRLASDNISLTGNRRDTFTYSVSPHARQRLGSFATVLARYTYDEVINEGDSVDSRSHRVNGALESGSRFERLGWRADYSRQRIENDDAISGDTKFERIDGTLRYRLTRQFSVFGNGGVENNEFETIMDETDGPFWRAGITWQPSRRTKVEGSYGERFFGRVAAFSINHRSRRTVWRASLDQDLTTTRERQLQRVLVQFVDPFGNPIVDPITGAPIAIPVDAETVTEEVFVRRRFQSSVTFQGNRTDVTLMGFQERRRFQRSGDEESVVGASAGVSRRLSRQNTIDVSGSWQQIDFRDEPREDTRWEGSARLSRQLGRSVNGALEYRYTNNDSNLAAQDFDENRLSAILSLIF